MKEWSKGSDNTQYYAYLQVQLPPDLDAETFDNGTAVDFRRAFKWPHQAKHERKGRFFATQKQANRFQESHPIDTVSTCFWDPKKPSKVAMTNRGGDWTDVWVGTSMLVFCVPAMMIHVLLRLGANRELNSESSDVQVRRPARAEQARVRRPTRAERAEWEEERRRAGRAEWEEERRTRAHVEADRAKMIRAVIATHR